MNEINICFFFHIMTLFRLFLPVFLKHTHTHTLISVLFFSYNSQRLYKDWNFLSPKCISAKFANFWIGFVYNTALFGCFLQTVVLPFHSLSRVYQFYQSFQRSNFWLCWYFSVVYWLSMKIFFLSLTLPSLFSFDLVYAFFFYWILRRKFKTVFSLYSFLMYAFKFINSSRVTNLGVSLLFWCLICLL